MTLRIIGAGLPRTGTTSLKQAIEQLSGEPCYHMTEVFPRLDTHLALWQGVLDGDLAAFDEIFDGFGAAVDWPASSFWSELIIRDPDALVLLSRRADAETWWKSIDQTVWEGMRRDTGFDAWDDMVGGLTARFGVVDLHSREQAIEAYEAHNQAVRDNVPAGRLLEWQPADGWAPLCAALDVDVPDEPFPRRNPTAEFRAMNGWD